MSDKAKRVNDLMQHDGWRDVMSILDEMSKTPQDELWEIMARKPDTLTGKTALKYAIRSKALTDFKAELYDLVAPLNPRQGQGK